MLFNDAFAKAKGLFMAFFRSFGMPLIDKPVLSRFLQADISIHQVVRPIYAKNRAKTHRFWVVPIPSQSGAPAKYTIYITKKAQRLLSFLSRQY